MLLKYFGPNAFLNFLRGMETLKGCQHSLRNASFLNFLRGMETFPAGVVVVKAQDLPKLP